MGFRLRPTSSGPGTSPLQNLQALSLLVLLLTALVPTTVGQCKRNSGKIKAEGHLPSAFVAQLVMCVWEAGGVHKVLRLPGVAGMMTKNSKIYLTSTSCVKGNLQALLVKVCRSYSQCLCERKTITSNLQVRKERKIISNH